MNKEPICPHCDKPFLLDDKIFWVANDRPYFNVKVHRWCWNEIKENLGKEFEDNLEKYLLIYDSKINLNKKTRK